MNLCYWARRKGLTSCSGRLDRAHWIPKQRLKKAGLTESEVWNEAAWDFMCRAHHHTFDGKSLKLAREDYPDCLLTFAAEHHFFWAGAEQGWLAEYREAA